MVGKTEKAAPPVAEPGSALATQDHRGGVRIQTEALGKVTKSGVALLQGISLTIQPGELVGVVGGSGAGKTTLLEALAGVSPANSGRVLFDDVDLYANRDLFRTILGYVPQDDIIHMDLPLSRTLRYAARLRLPPDSPEGTVGAAVDEALATLDLVERAQTRVAALSGGQRKRASIAVEMLTQPKVFFLDEPTSGLDPATSAELLKTLRSLADQGATVVFTTHSVQDLTGCDRVIFLAQGGRLAFVGSADEARTHFAVASVEQIYERLGADWADHHETGLPPQASMARLRKPGAPVVGARGRSLPGAFRQLAVLTARSLETMTRNKLTLAILLGSPAMVVAMFVVLFRRGAFAFDDPSPTSILMILFWVTFGSFFFGLTYGLLQIVTERAIVRREYLVGLRLTSYLFSKVALLLPFLLVVNVVMLAVLRALDRLPSDSLSTYASVAVTLTLDASAALATGLLASAAVSTPSQATLALPMLCFPAVLFSGAILPVNVMASLGKWISAVIPVRWAFEGVGHDLGVRHLLNHGGSDLGPPLVETYGSSGMEPTGVYWLYLAVFTIVLLGAARWILLRSVRRGGR